MYHFNIKISNFFILFRLNNIYLNILKNQNKMKKKKNTKNWVPKTPETNLENKGFTKKPAWLNVREENPGVSIQTKEISRTKFLAGIDPVNEGNHTVAVFKPRQLGVEFDSFGWRVALNNIKPLEKEDLGKDLSKLFEETGTLIISHNTNDFSWAVEQLKKGEIVRNSAWPEYWIGIIMKVQPNPSADVKLITEGDVSFQYKFTNEDVLFGTWEIVK